MMSSHDAVLDGGSEDRGTDETGEEFRRDVRLDAAIADEGTEPSSAGAGGAPADGDHDPQGFGASSSKSLAAELSSNKESAARDSTSVQTKQPKMEAFEIEMGRAAISSTRSGSTGEEDQEEHPGIAAVRSEDTLDEEGDDMESLLGSEANGNKRSSKRKPLEHHQESVGGGATTEIGQRSYSWCLPCCGECEPEIRLGNLRVISPRIYTWTGGWGVVGPHWFGPPCVVALVFFATFFFAYQSSWRKGRPFTAAACILMAISTTYYLLNAAYRNPGVIVKGRLTLPDPLPRTWRFCETCQYYQPPRAAHCPDCNVCIAGFDHHCVWMGTCIGAGNFKPFMRFNLSWLFYLLYAIIWEDRIQSEIL